MQQTMRVKFQVKDTDLLWDSFVKQLEQYNLKVGEWYVISEIDADGNYKLEGIDTPNYILSAYFTTPEPVLTPCPSDWQPEPGHTVDHYEAECLDNEWALNYITVGEVYQICDITNNNDFVIIDDKCEREVRRKNRFYTPTLRAEFRDKPEQVQSEVIDSNESNQPDPVNHPTHYNQNGYEVKDLIAAFNLNFFRGNCVKYASRAHLKGQELQDLMKVKTNIDFEIERMTKGEGVPITAELLVDIAMELLQQAKKMMQDGTKDI